MKSESTLVFTGDIGFDKYMDGKWDDENLIAPEVLDFLQSGDHVIANVEGALVNAEDLDANSQVRELLHAMNPKATKVLDQMHADIWNLCNNHIMDAGAVGVSETLRHASIHHAQTIGAGMNLEEAKKPLYLEEAGGIGMFAVGYRRGCKPAGEDQAGCLLWNEMDLIQENITEIKKKCRWCIIVAHGGEEFTSLPTCYTRERYHRFLEMGADIIVSHHPHVPMNYERVGEKIIFYSLGNFIFDTDYQRAQFNTELGLLIKLKLTEESWDFEPLGLRIQRGEEKIVADALPRIFTDVQEEEYRLLEPLAAKQMVAAYKRQLLYLKPNDWKDATEEEWRAEFLKDVRSGRVIGEGLDFQIVVPIADRAADGKWKESKLEEVKQYILEQM